MCRALRGLRRLSSRVGDSNAAAFFSTTAACLGATQAVLHMFVAFALLRAFLACVRAEFAELRGSLAASGHEKGRGAAQLRAFKVQGDAPREHFHVLFFQAGIRTVLAFKRALVAGIDTATHGFVAHGGLLLLGKWLAADEGAC